jgi:light-regulated signal transduction histidine kinase (bacteriophytochrome)
MVSLVGRPVRFPDMARERPNTQELEGSAIRSVLAVPVLSRSSEWLGCLVFGHSEPDAFAPRHERIAAGLAAQAAIALDNARLFSEAERATAALRHSNDELRRSNEDLEHFAWSASHDLQEPLRQVATFSQFLQRRYADRLDSEGDQFLRYIVQGARRMETLVRDILTYTHTAQAAWEEARPTDARSVFKKVLADMRTAVEETSATIEIGDLPVVQAQESHLGRLFQNLLSNSLKYRGSQTPRIQVHAKPESAGGFWRFSFSDNGIGIDPRYHQQVFALFRRLHSSAQYEGSGIGLAICRKIVERYGGRIWVESQTGNGATFHFTLPVREHAV